MCEGRALTAKCTCPSRYVSWTTTGLKVCIVDNRLINYRSPAHYRGPVNNRGAVNIRGAVSNRRPVRHAGMTHAQAEPHVLVLSSTCPLSAQHPQACTQREFSLRCAILTQAEAGGRCNLWLAPIFHSGLISSPRSHCALPCPVRPALQASVCAVSCLDTWAMGGPAATLQLEPGSAQP